MLEISATPELIRKKTGPKPLEVLRSLLPRRHAEYNLLQERQQSFQITWKSAAGIRQQLVLHCMPSQFFLEVKGKKMICLIDNILSQSHKLEDEEDIVFSLSRLTVGQRLALGFEADDLFSDVEIRFNLRTGTLQIKTSEKQRIRRVHNSKQKRKIEVEDIPTSLQTLQINYPQQDNLLELIPTPRLDMKVRNRIKTYGLEIIKLRSIRRLPNDPTITLQTLQAIVDGKAEVFLGSHKGPQYKETNDDAVAGWLFSIDGQQLLCLAVCDGVSSSKYPQFPALVALTAAQKFLVLVSKNENLLNYYKSLAKKKTS